jgi:LPXTG-motif cell wall-anchored protein
VKITIAKSLVSSIQNVKAYLDGKQLDVSITSEEDSWLLSFTYMHSTHQVRVVLAAESSEATFLGIEYWTWIAVVVVVAVAGFAGFLLWRKKKRT